MIYLSSQSPRRKELLRQINVEFRTLNVSVSEIIRSQETPQDYVKRVALLKAQAGKVLLSGEEKSMPVLGADTIVVVENDILLKPKDRQDGLNMLARLSGVTHQVMSAVALVTAHHEWVDRCDSKVTMRTISESERELYWDTGEPLDKAGGYAIQGMGAIFIKSITGSYSGVMGLPLYETAQLLARV